MRRTRKQKFTQEQRYWSKVDRRGPEECWGWLAYKIKTGHGQFHHTRSDGSSGLLAHRYVWELKNGPIPPDLMLEHKCKNPWCQNPIHMFMVTEESRFWAKVDKRGKNECWNWLAYKDKIGYGRFIHTSKDGSRSTLAHRYSHELAHGAIPPGMCVCHKCDNPTCVNPRHLFLGTQTDNNRDCVAKGRQAKKITSDQVAEIREIYAAGGVFQYELARKYGLSQAHVSGIINGKRRGSIDKGNNHG